MKVSELLNLKKTQHELDFVDVNVSGDTPLFIDPHIIAQQIDKWSLGVNRTIRSFFQTFIDLVRRGGIEEAGELFQHLKEVNNTRLGMSRGKPRGHGVGPDDAARIFESLLESEAVKTGLLEDLEDCRIFVAGIDKDKTSDMTTNIVRRHLVQYTIEQAVLWGMPLTDDVPTGDFWDADSLAWTNTYDQALIIDEEPILLVPKRIVSFSSRYSPEVYHRHFVLNFFQQEHLRLSTSLVQERRDKRGRVVKRFVTKKSILAIEPEFSKDYLAKFTNKYKEIFQKFKSGITGRHRMDANLDAQVSGLSVQEVAAHLKAYLVSIPSGKDAADAYHNAMIGILEFLFHPQLARPVKELPQNQGRKKVDISFDNASRSGFFYDLHTIHKIPCSYVYVELKNYKSDVANPELDQLGGRFSINQGQFGILACRKIDDLNLFLARCSDTWQARNGLIIPLVDDDVVAALDSVESEGQPPLDKMLEGRMRLIRHRSK